MPITKCGSSIVDILETSLPSTPIHNKQHYNSATPNTSILDDFESDNDSGSEYLNSQQANTCAVPFGFKENTRNKEDPLLPFKRNITERLNFKIIQPSTSQIIHQTRNTSDSESINGSLLQMIDRLGTHMESDDEIEIEFSPDLLSLEGKDRYGKPTDTFDCLSLQMSSEDDCDYRTRFERFFGFEYAVSSCAESMVDTDLEYFAGEEYAESQAHVASQPVQLPSNLQLLHDKDTTQVMGSSEPVDDPPPYTEIAETESAHPKTSVRNLVIPTTFTPSSVNAKRKISVKIKKSSNDLSKATAGEIYQLDKYLPPYRSLLDPTKVFDYRTNTYIESGSKRIVSIHSQNSSNNRIISLVIKANNNLQQKPNEVSDGVSSYSAMATADMAPPIEYKTKPCAKFQDLSDVLVQQVLSHLDQKDLVHCLYVSKRMNNLTIPTLYYYPKFTSTYRVAQFVHTILCNSILAKLVKVLDLSAIDLPVLLTEAERLKHQDNLIYGMSSSATDVLCNTSKIVYAGWRDWKFRNHPVHGNNKRARSRSSSVSTVCSASSMINQNEVEVFTSIFYPELNRAKSSSYINDKPKNKQGHRSRSWSTSNLKLEDDGFLRNMKRMFNSKKKKMSKAKEKEGVPVRKKIKQSIIVESKQNNLIFAKPKTTVTFATEAVKREAVPFRTPHPVMNSTLRQYCFKRDIPVGFVIHLFEECINLEEINLDGVLFSTDYKLSDHESFNWRRGTGAISERAIGDRPVFWSDTDSEIDSEQNSVELGVVQIMEIHRVWETLLKLQNVKVLSLKRINSIEQSLVTKILFESNFANLLRTLKCHGSGMVKRNEWDVLESANSWRSYLSSK